MSAVSDSYELFERTVDDQLWLKETDRRNEAVRALAKSAGTKWAKYAAPPAALAELLREGGRSKFDALANQVFKAHRILGFVGRRDRPSFEAGFLAGAEEVARKESLVLDQYLTGKLSKLTC